MWKIGNEIVTGMGADHIRFPELPETLYSRPTLIWTVQNDGAAKHRVEASHLASRLAWNADYVLTVARDDKAADLNGWVTLVNNSGTAFAMRSCNWWPAISIACVSSSARWLRRCPSAATPAPAANMAGGVLGLSPLYDGPQDDD